MIAGFPTEYSTIHTVLKTVQAMTRSLNQQDSVVTFDLATYTGATLKSLQTSLSVWGISHRVELFICHRKEV